MLRVACFSLSAVWRLTVRCLAQVMRERLQALCPKLFVVRCLARRRSRASGVLFRASPHSHPLEDAYELLAVLRASPEALPLSLGTDCRLGLRAAPWRASPSLPDPSLPFVL